MIFDVPGLQDDAEVFCGKTELWCRCVGHQTVIGTLQGLRAGASSSALGSLCVPARAASKVF